MAKIVDRWMEIRWRVRSRKVKVRWSCQVARCLLLHLITWLLASLGLLYLPCGQLHVWVPHPLLVQLLLGPEQHLEADFQRALCGLCMLSFQNCSIKLAGHLLSVSRGHQQVSRPYDALL
eukprot:GFUD01104974.1.p1 GENE.GFUD01104974.1~~GFUD01104974.1.p1  ORF type:complete len:120 (+),score=27.00 GFUD01104974.1:249-608(+)